MAETVLQVPIGDLKITKTNARKDHTVDKALVASIASVGLLYPLIVDATEDGKWDVVDGAQRLLAIKQGLQAGILHHEQWERIDCVPRGNGATTAEGLEVSLHANLRTPMHPLDECEAILTLSKKGEDKEAIALRFGQDLKWLEQRVKLAQLVPEIKQAFRDGTIGLGTAMIFTLGSADQQKAFLKRHKKLNVNQGQVHAAMTEKKISAKVANFDLALYPEKSVQRDLFAAAEDPLAGVWLLDAKKFAELQDAWAADEIEKYKQLGYDSVKVLGRDDWQTLQSYVEFEGKVRTAEQRAKLTVFLKADHHGHIDVHENMILRKTVEKAKVKPAKNGAASDTTAEEPKPMKASELTVAQHEIVAALAASALYTQTIEGDEMLAQFLVVDSQFGKGTWTQGGQAHKHNGTIKRWERLNEQYPAEQLINGSEIEAIGQLEPAKLDYETYAKLPKKTRDHLFFAACAALIFAPYQAIKPNLRELAQHDWLVPGEDFFKRYRTDQLIDYRRRSGDKEAGKTAKKKGDHVKDCVVAAVSPTAYKLGLIK